MNWVHARDDKTSYLFLRLTPNARQDEICGVYKHADGKSYIQMNVRAVPENGKANKAVVDFLARLLSITKSDIKLKSGSKSRFKCIEIKLPVELVRQDMSHVLNS